MLQRLFTPTRFTLLFAAVVALGVVADGQAAKPKVKPPVLSIAPSSGDFTEGAPIAFSATLENPNATPINVFAFQSGIVDAKVERLDGRSWKKLRPLEVRTQPLHCVPNPDPSLDGADPFRSLEPGGRGTFPLRLIDTSKASVQAAQWLLTNQEDVRPEAFPGGAVLVFPTYTSRKGCIQRTYVLPAPGQYRLTFIYDYVPAAGAPANLFVGRVKAEPVSLTLR